MYTSARFIGQVNSKRSETYDAVEQRAFAKILFASSSDRRRVGVLEMRGARRYFESVQREHGRTVHRDAACAAFWHAYPVGFSCGRGSDPGGRHSLPLPGGSRVGIEVYGPHRAGSTETRRVGHPPTPGAARAGPWVILSCGPRNSAASLERRTGTARPHLQLKASKLVPTSFPRSEDRSVSSGLFPRSAGKPGIASWFLNRSITIESVELDWTDEIKSRQESASEGRIRNVPWGCEWQRQVQLGCGSRCRTMCLLCVS